MPCDFLPVAKVFAECFSYINSPGGSGLIVRELSVFFKERERCSKHLDECNREAKEISGKRGKKLKPTRTHVRSLYETLTRLCAYY